MGVKSTVAPVDAPEFIRVWRGRGVNDVNSINVQSLFLILGVDDGI